MTRTQAIEDARLLLPFLTEWLAWAEADAPEHPLFWPWVGLCGNCDSWDEGEHYHDHDSFYPTTKALERALARFDSPSYPFGGYEAYNADRYVSGHHRNPQRLRWVRRKIARLTAVLAALDDPNTST